MILIRKRYHGYIWEKKDLIVRTLKISKEGDIYASFFAYKLFFFNFESGLLARIHTCSRHYVFRKFTVNKNDYWKKVM